MSGLLDFGSGALAGAETGYKLSGGNPYVAGGLGLVSGAISLFGGSEQRGIEREANRIATASGKQQLRLNEFSLAQARRQDKREREAEARRKQFGQMLAQYFQRQQGGGV